MLNLPAATTALVLVDLQEGIVPIPILAPRSGQQVTETGKTLAARFGPPLRRSCWSTWDGPQTAETP